MKTLILIISVLFLVSFSKKNTQNVNIFDAIENGQIKFIATSNGSLSGGSILLQIENLKNIKTVIIPSGTRFKSEFGNEQDLLNTDEEIIVLKPNKTTYTVNGFCVQLSNMSPSSGSQFTIAKETNENLIKLSHYLNKRGFDNGIKQSALWSVSDNKNVSGIYQGNNEQVENLREYVCSLTDQENVWYNTDQTYSVDENRNIVHETTKVEGLISYTVKETGNMKMEVCKEDGEVLRTLGGTTPITNLGEHRFNFSVKVKGWKIGNYSIKLKIGEEVIHSEEFEIA
jgi:hypothetical protein